MCVCVCVRMLEVGDCDDDDDDEKQLARKQFNRINVNSSYAIAFPVYPNRHTRTCTPHKHIHTHTSSCTGAQNRYTVFIASVCLEIPHRAHSPVRRSEPITLTRTHIHTHGPRTANAPLRCVHYTVASPHTPPPPLPVHRNHTNISALFARLCVRTVRPRPLPLRETNCLLRGAPQNPGQSSHENSISGNMCAPNRHASCSRAHLRR